MPYIGVYGNYYTWRSMQAECDRWGAPVDKPIDPLSEEKTNAATTTDPGGTD